MVRYGEKSSESKHLVQVTLFSLKNYGLRLVSLGFRYLVLKMT